jgi:thioredoxin-like negative regulator of GroEL
MYPIIEQLQKEGYDITIIDVQKNKATAEKYNITILPTTVVLRGQEEITRFTGVVSIDEIRKAMKSLDYRIW